MQRKKWIIGASTVAISYYVFGSKKEKYYPYLTSPIPVAHTEAIVVARKPNELLNDTTKEASSTLNSKNDIEFWKKPSRSSEIMKFGYPGFDNLRTFEDFVLSYDRRTRTAHWVVEHLTPERMVYNEEVNRSKSEFKPDTSIHPFFQSQNSDYFRSGYDRGHLAAAANHRKSQKAIDQTFFLTNMSPQVGKGFNRDKWNDLEKHARKLAYKNLNVYICTGPLYLPKKEEDGNLYVRYKVIGQNHVAVPTHFFKVIVTEPEPNEYILESYLLPNEAIPDEKPIKDFLVPLDIIERGAGFLIFEQLPKDRIKKINGIPLELKNKGWLSSENDKR